MLLEISGCRGFKSPWGHHKTMWMELSEQQQVEYYNKWIDETLKDETEQSLREHIIKHAHEIMEKEAVEWAASMRNLVDAFERKVGIKPDIELRLKKLDNKYKKDPERFTPPPDI
jgi:hypothetical protein